MESQTNPHGAGATARAVADDMAAIFGSVGRASADTPVAKRPASARSIKSNRAILAISAGTLAATIAAGLYAGKSVIANPLATPASRVEDRAPQAVGRRTLGASPVVADAVVVAPAPSPAVALVPAPVSPRETSPLPVAPASPAEPPPLPRAPAFSPAANPMVRHASPATVVPPASSSPAASHPLGCDDDGDACLDSRIDVAERRVADAYEQAVKAGVRPRDLSGYRGEWNRARREATERPRYALRLYAMITSDLLNLADYAELRDGAAER